MEGIIEKLMEVAPDVWAALIKQQYVWGTIMGFTALLLIGLGTVLIWVMNDDKLKDDDKFAAICIVVLLYAIGILVLGMGVMKLINPQYYALMELKP